MNAWRPLATDMDITDLIAPDRVFCRSEAASKKRAFELLCELIAKGQPDLNVHAVFDSLIGRERLGSTGLGRGVALPHGRLAQSRKAIGAFIKFEQGLNFDAMDQQPVHLVFALLVPEHYTDEHLKILAYLAEMFSEQALCERLLAATSDRALYDLLVEWRPSAPAH